METNTKMKIRNIIWDFGVVLIDLDFEAFLKNLSDLGIQNPEVLLHHPKALDYEKGKISTQEFFKHLKQECKKWLTYSDIQRAWNSILLQIPDSKISKLKKYKSLGLNQVMLSNTNEEHIRSIWQDLGPFKGKQFSSLFTKKYFSQDLKMRKPEAEIYIHVLHNQNWKAEETLFVDDNEANIRAAEALGIVCHHYKKGESLNVLDKVLSIHH